MTGDIYKMVVSEEERIMQLDRTKNLIRIYQRGNITKAEIEQTYNEWKLIAERLNKGGLMIQETRTKIDGNLETNSHFISLVHLYEMLMKMCIIYDGFFQIMFCNRPDIYDQAKGKILETLS
jgi:hypothetical protein